MKTNVLHSFLAFTLTIGACVPPKDAAGAIDGDGMVPTDLDGISHYIFANNQTPDGANLGLAVSNLEDWLSQFADSGKGVQKGTSLADRSWSLVALRESDVANLPARPDRPISAAHGISVAGVSQNTIACHAALQTLVDALPAEPSSSRYLRTFLDQDMPKCFIDATCTAMKTSNDVQRSTAIFSAEFTLWKDFRWVRYENNGEQRRAFISRGWLSRPADGPDGPGGNQLWQSYDMDVWIERDNKVLRYEALWTESELYFLGVRVDPETESATLTGATDSVFNTADAFIKNTLMPEGVCAPVR